jgi:quinol monooxygenase YgiN
LHRDVLRVMFLASILFRVQPHKRDELLSAIDDTIVRMRHSSGCERCRLLVDTEDPNSFTIFSEWRQARDADLFFDSRDFQIFRGARILLRDDPVMILDDVRSRATRLIQGR